MKVDPDGPAVLIGIPMSLPDAMFLHTGLCHTGFCEGTDTYVEVTLFDGTEVIVNDGSPRDARNYMGVWELILDPLSEHPNPKVNMARDDAEKAIADWLPDSAPIHLSLHLSVRGDDVRHAIIREY